ncbi:hypothetical protein [Bosea sp. FBZP-16]|uniref:hypothetical protein n=1 Tax=Bosea sp. FBZP-16 TaxID=2065382 RepID=UPI000C3145B0|nr:hypothetical protein [Bosea sp. FBZP-16]
MPEAVSSNDCKRLVSEARVAGRLEGLKEALDASDVEDLIAVWIRRPRADTPEGKAWEAGVRQAYEWKSAAILSLIEASQG